MSTTEQNLPGGETTLSAVMQKRQNNFRYDMWLSQEPHIQRILNEGLGQFIIREEDPELVKNIFRVDRNFILGCMDERQQVCRIAFAGPGVFYTNEQLQAIAKAMQTAGIKIKRVYRHRDCGAEKFVKNQLMTEQGLSTEKAEKVIRERVAYFASLLGAEVAWYNSMKYSRFHFARALFMVGTTAFDIGAIQGLSPFQLNIRFLPDIDTVLHRINLAIDAIAFGDHGPGREMFEKAPFVIGIIGDSTNKDYSFETLNRHLQPLLPKYEGLVEVRGFDVPKEFLPAA
jgi:hypothetical protein